MATREASTDRNISLVQGWNLIGYSSNETNLSLSNAVFHNGSDNYSFTEAVTANKLKNYNAYYDSSSSLTSARKYKFLGPSGVDDDAFRNKQGYWVYVNGSEGGNLTLPGVGGSTSGQTFDWADLRVMNSSGGEKGIADAGGSVDWITEQISYWDADLEDFRLVCSVIGLGGGSGNCLSTSFNSWQGYFIYSNKDNLTLIRQN